MICEKDAENGKAFWVATAASRVIMPNGEEAKRRTYGSNDWYLLGADDEYELKDNRIVISEKKTLVQSFLKVTCWGRAGVEEVLDGLEKILESFTEEKLTSLQYELDMFREDFDDFLTPEQVEWFDRLYDIVASELDARWLLRNLEERRIFKIERSN